VVCVEWGPLHLYLYMLDVGLVGDKLGNHVELPLHGTMQPLEMSGPERRWQGCERTPGAGAPGLAPLVGFWVGLGLICVGAQPRFVSCLGLCLVLLRFSALCFSELRLLFIFSCI